MSTVRQTTRVLIVDDHAMVRQGLRSFLELQDEPSSPATLIAGEASDGAEAIGLARRLPPDVVLLGLVMPVMRGTKAIPRIIESSTHTRVLILTSFHAEDQHICPACPIIALTVQDEADARRRAVEAGMDASLVKGAPIAALVAAIAAPSPAVAPTRASR